MLNSLNSVATCLTSGTGAEVNANELLSLVIILKGVYTWDDHPSVLNHTCLMKACIAGTGTLK